MDIVKETAGVRAGKSELEKALSGGLHGAPEFKREKKLRYLSALFI
ncbi:MAG: hypothetical protein ACOY40_10340 [Bacillota bacterium]